MGATIDTIKELVRRAQEDDVLGLAAELAYRFLFSLFPLLIFVAAIGGVASQTLGIENPTDRAMETLGEMLPDEAEEVVEGQLGRVLEQQNPGLLSLGLIVALWAASGATKAIMKAMNRAYNVDEHRSFIRKNLVGLGLTVVLGVSVIAGFILLLAGQIFAGEIAELLGMEAWAAPIIAAGQWLVAGLLLLVAIAFLYWAAPNTDIPFRWVSPGAVLFVVGWIAATAAFGFYVANFGAYADTYGALGGVIILMLWFYITGLVLLAGAELNAVLARRHAPDDVATNRRDARDSDDGSSSRSDAETAGSPYARSVAPAGAPAPSRSGAMLAAAVGGVAALRALGGNREPNGDGSADPDGHSEHPQSPEPRSREGTREMR